MLHHAADAVVVPAHAEHARGADVDVVVVPTPEKAFRDRLHRVDDCVNQNREKQQSDESEICVQL